MAIRSAAQIVEEALRQVGVMSTYDTAPAPEHFAVALNRFDMMVNEMTGTEILWFFMPKKQRIALIAGQAEYDLDALIEPDFQMVRAAFLIRGDAKPDEISLLRHRTFDDLQGETTTQEPYAVFVERNSKPVLTVLPTPEVDGMELELRGFAYSPDLTRDRGQIEHGFDQAWELMLVYQLAQIIGDGPVITLPEARLARIERKAEEKLTKLKNRAGRENVKRARFTRMRDF